MYLFSFTFYYTYIFHFFCFFMFFFFTRIKFKPIAVQEKEQRDKGLQTSIAEESNKGFQLLKKMGYIEGTALGKQQQQSKPTNDNSNEHSDVDDESVTRKALLEPLPIVMKLERTGIGAKAELLELDRKSVKRRIDSNNNDSNNTNNDETENGNVDFETQQEEFRKRLRTQVSNKFIHKDFEKARKIIEVLDEKENIDDGKRFYSVSIEEDKEPVSSGNNNSSSNNNNINSSDRHLDRNNALEEDEKEEKIDTPIETQLQDALCYLRLRHFYCLYCGTSFSSYEDLESNCPGITREDHDG